MRPNRINLFILSVTFLLTANANAEDIPPPEIHPYKIPTFTGKAVNWHKIKPAINPMPRVNGDYIFSQLINCYPIKPWGVTVGLKAGLNFRPTNSSEIVASDSSKYYAGIVFNMPLYSGVEIDKQRERANKRRIKTAESISSLVKAVAKKRRSERMMGLYLSLEKRAQARAMNGIAPVNEQIVYLEKVAKTQADYDMATADIEGERIGLVAQCRPEVADKMNSIILNEINKKEVKENG